MKDDFLPIPDAPDYEINSELICRNSKTDHIMTPFLKKRNQNLYYSLFSQSNHVGRDIVRTAKTLRAQAVAAVTDSTFEPIPSLDGRYEVNNRGIIRNAKTKRIIKRDKDGFLHVLTKDGRIGVHPNTYLWEVHGSYRKPKRQKVKCSAENEWGKHFFDSLSACARFLASKVFLSFEAVKYYYLVHRKPEIYGWKITYYEEDPSADNWNRQALGFEALRMQKLDKERGLA